MQKMREHEPGRPRPDDSHLRTHGAIPLFEWNKRGSGALPAGKGLFAGTSGRFRRSTPARASGACDIPDRAGVARRTRFKSSAGLADAPVRA
jgi:hypothetical protein